MRRSSQLAGMMVGCAIATTAFVRGDIVAAAIGGMVGGVMYALAVEWMNSWTRRGLIKKYGEVPVELPVRPRLAMTVYAPYDCVADVVLGAISEFARLNSVSKEGANAMQVLADIPRSIRHGSGELLDVCVAGHEVGGVRVVIASRPRHDSTIIDFGRNMSHVLRIKDAVVKAVGRAQIELESVGESGPV